MTAENNRYCQFDPTGDEGRRNCYKADGSLLVGPGNCLGLTCYFTATPDVNQMCTC
jgi:hypothetical protein